MSEPRNHNRFEIELPAPRDEVFSYLTEHFNELWPGKMTTISEGAEPNEPMGLGYTRRVEPLGMPRHLDEEIVTHERPSLIEYTVINDDEALIHNHLGRLELTETDTGTRLLYTIDYDYRPAFLGAVARGALALTWRLNAARVLRRAFPG